MQDCTITDILEKGIQQSKADLCILRWMRREQLQTTLIDGNPGTSSQIILAGIGCRSFINGSWGFASTTDSSDINAIIKTSERIAQYKPGAASVSHISGYTMTQDLEGTTLESVDTFFELARKAYQSVKSLPHVRSCRIGVLVINDQKIVVTSDGVLTQVVEPRILGNVTVIAGSGSTLSHYSEVVGGGYRTLETLSTAAETAAETALHRLNSKAPPSGRKKVLLGGETVGLLTHEAVGHAAEADIAQNGSCLSGKRNKPVASPLVSIVDDATVPGYFGSITVDDEGVKGQKTVIIKDGILKSFLHSRETAAEDNSTPTGNGRAWLYSREPHVRMTNTFLTPQDYTFEELLKEVGNGLYLKGYEGGNAVSAGNYMIITTLAQKIQHGELQNDLYRGPVIYGDTLQTLQNVKAVGDESTFVMVPSMCGKSGSAFVGQGGAAVVTELTLGGL